MLYWFLGVFKYTNIYKYFLNDKTVGEVKIRSIKGIEVCANVINNSDKTCTNVCVSF